LSRSSGFDRGLPIDRYYVEKFLEAHSSDIRGHVLEVGDDIYARRFEGGPVARLDILSVDKGAKVTIVGDLSMPGTLPVEFFDCAILTQTLQYVFDLSAGLKHIRASLRSGGVALITVPGLAPVSLDRWKDSYYWRFTAASVTRLLEDAFGVGNVQVSAFGNLYAATLFLHGAAAEEADPAKLQSMMSEYAVVIAARAVAK
jgi:hypothetical protein